MSRPASESLGAVRRTRTVSSCADSVERNVYACHDLTSLRPPPTPTTSTQQPSTTTTTNKRSKSLAIDDITNNNLSSSEHRSRKRNRMGNQPPRYSKSSLHQNLNNNNHQKDLHTHNRNLPLTARGQVDVHSDRPPGNDNMKKSNPTYSIRRNQSRTKSIKSTKSSKLKYTLPCEDDKDGHLIYKLGEGLSPDPEYPHGRYKILSDLGEGTFGKVLECWDRRECQRVAIKVVRSVNKYREAARLEIDILFHLKMHDPKGFCHCVKLHSWFDYRSHICLVFEKLGPSLYEQLRRNDFRPFPLEQVRKYAFQLLESISFVHSLTLIHTDLKPENILLNSPDCTTDIKLIDFGSATFESNHHSAVISTRHYRAPEVILGLGWTYPCDLWSVGCILVELYTGKALFQTHENLEHLAMMRGVLGPIPQSMIQKADGSGQKYFSQGQGGHCNLNWPAGASSKESVHTVRRIQSLQEIILRRAEHANFLDLVSRLLAFDPKSRCTSAEALQHPFFHETSPSPDFPISSPSQNSTRIIQPKSSDSDRKKTGRKRGTTIENDIEANSTELPPTKVRKIEDEGDDTATEMHTGAEHSDHTVVAPISPQNQLPEDGEIS